jgi:hypothetical protein
VIDRSLNRIAESFVAMALSQAVAPRRQGRPIERGGRAEAITDPGNVVTCAA